MMWVKESLFEDKSMEVSGGLVIICDGEILLAHPTSSRWKGTYSIPKGHVEDGESSLNAAIRETKEEIGLVVKKSQISEESGSIHYIDNSGKAYKRVDYFVVYLNKKPELRKKDLQLKEIDHAKFFDLKEAEEVIFWRFKPLLKYLK